MFKKLKEWLFGDWVLKEIQAGNWRINDSFGTYTMFCTFKIFYSKRKNKYKLKCFGYKPKNHQLYIYMINKVIKLNND